MGSGDLIRRGSGQGKLVREGEVHSQLGRNEQVCRVGVISSPSLMLHQWEVTMSHGCERDMAAVRPQMELGKAVRDCSPGTQEVRTGF